MSGPKLSFVSALIFVLSASTFVTSASFYELDRFNRACIKNHGCDGEVVNVKLHVSHLCCVVVVAAVVY